jgi:hypothetical protein
MHVVVFFVHNTASFLVDFTTEGASQSLDNLKRFGTHRQLDTTQIFFTIFFP